MRFTSCINVLEGLKFFNKSFNFSQLMKKWLDSPRKDGAKFGWIQIITQIKIKIPISMFLGKVLRHCSTLYSQKWPWISKKKFNTNQSKAGTTLRTLNPLFRFSTNWGSLMESTIPTQFRCQVFKCITKRKKSFRWKSLEGKGTWLK